tara:strand:- start:1759 stop:2565 length:807 start_codon:yes stop_codon:yes gene_type:complete
MVLSSIQIDQFATEGYTIVHHFFSKEETVTMCAELDRLVVAGKLRNVSTDGDGATPSDAVMNLQICPLSPSSDIFRALPFAERVREAVRQLIGDEFVLQLDQIFLKPPRHGGGTNWHQDNAYFGIPDPQQGTGMWIALHDATVANGTMRVIPSSFRRVYDHERDPGSDHHVSCVVDEETEAIVPVEVEAGGVLFFNYGTAHCTKANDTDTARAGLALHFLKSEHRALREGWNPTVLSGPDYSRGENEYGTIMEGRWEEYVAAPGCAFE